MKIVMKTPVMDCIGNVQMYHYCVHQDIAYQVVGNITEEHKIPVLSVHKRHVFYMPIGTLVTPVDVEFTFIPQLGDEVLL